MSSNLLNTALKFVATVGSIFTMIFSPVALGSQAENALLKKQIEQFLSETQLGKRVTYKEFWNRTKHLYSGQVYSDVERYFMQAPNALMPEFSLKESVSSTGEKIPTLTISENGKSYQMQIFGEKAKFAKFNNVVLSENDMLLITPAMKRIISSDIKLKKEHDKKISKQQQPKFSGFPALDVKTWKKLNQKERAMYMLMMRQAWSDARRVLELSSQSKESPIKKKTSKLENFWRLLEPDAWAVSGKDGEGCLVAGYISEYKGGVCTVKMLSKHYDADDVLVKKSNTICSAKPNQIACNPYVYGAPNGSPICVTTSEASFQKASHAEGPCDSKSPLGNPSNFPFLVDPKKTGPERYADGNLKKGPDGKPISLADEYKRQQMADSSYVENYLKGIFKLNGKDINFDQALTDESLKQILSIKEQFDLEMANAVSNCKSDASKKHEKNFWDACDQMQRRFLFVAEFLSKKPGCVNNKAVNPSTLKCPCDGGEEVPPGAQCKAGAVVNNEPKSEKQEKDLQCTNGTVEKDGACVCEDGKEPSGDDKKCGAGFNWKPWLIGAGVVGGAALLYFLLKKKKKDKPDAPFIPPQPHPQGCQVSCPANTTQNPTTCACDPVTQQPNCQAPKVLVDNVCSCPTTNACTPGQQVYNLNTCQCDSVAQPGICPDGVTQYFTPPGPTSCPAPTICQNGTQVYPPDVCPATNEGGSGTNPNDTNSGGVPTAN